MPEIDPSAPRLVIRRDPESPIQSDPAVDWAVQQVADALTANGITVAEMSADKVSSGEPDVELAASVGADRLPESYLFEEAGPSGRLVLRADDPRGFSYGLLDLLDAAEPGGTVADLLDGIGRGRHDAAVPVRGIQRNFCNVDQDSEWFHDRGFWTEYLDWLATSRFNRFHLAFAMQYNYSHDTVTDNYLCLVYPFLFEVDGYQVAAEGVDAEEQRRNLDSLRFVAAETKRRGLHFQLGLWNHAYDYGAESRERFPITGLDEGNHADYSAAGLAKLLDECPGIDGFTFRVHYEGGIAEAGHEIFWDKVFSAASRSGRDLEIDMHAKGVDQLLLDSLAGKPGLRPVISAKYWAEHCGLPYHQVSIRDREAARPVDPGADLRGVTNFSRRFTRYGYGDFLSEERQADLMFRIWPGTQRLLLAGSPDLAAGFGRSSTFGGARGMDVCEPLSFKGRDDTAAFGDRDPYVDPELRMGTAVWKKYKYGYLLLGRLMHDPDADPRVWRRHLTDTYGEAAAAVEAALNSLSKVLPLVTVVHGASGSNNLYWPEMYNNLPISARIHSGTPISERKPDPRAEKYGISYAYSAQLDDEARGEALIDYTEQEKAELLTELLLHDTDDAVNWGGISPFDPGLFSSVDEFVDDLVAGRQSAKYTPLEVAELLDGLVRSAQDHLALLDVASTEPDPSSGSRTGDHSQLRRTLVDLQILSRLGTFFAGKFRAAVHYAVFRATGDRSQLAASITVYRPARDAFAEIGGISADVYQSRIAFGKEPYEGGSWADRVPAIDRDLAALEAELAGVADRGRSALLDTVRPRMAPVELGHQPPDSFARGQELEIRVSSAPDVEQMILHYRHVDQSQRLQQIAMTRSEDGFFAVIGKDYTDTDYPLMYFFSLQDRSGRRTFAPGLDASLANQPYHLLHSNEYRAIRSTTEQPAKGN
ncbi:hypothetical protein [Microlunatus soli]|uniref:Uncharacterized protein n=1 Tax=Microlunatus soli TaxID=630515 RepID=A0A1H1QKE1_9ACTN|nr:hypothetical protein [Microlunatus soli]SDS23803.1 hypothetical protein SAMN04489812_1298 [Microlunatus soli]